MLGLTLLRLEKMQRQGICANHLLLCFLSARVRPKFEDLNVTWNCFRQFFLIFDSTGLFFLHFTVSGLKHLFNIIRTNFVILWQCRVHSDDCTMCFKFVFIAPFAPVYWSLTNKPMYFVIL